MAGIRDSAALAARAAEAIAARAGGLRPRLALVLGSGLGGFTARLTPAAAFDYSELPGFPAPGVGGHAGRLLLGDCTGLPLAVLAGRSHAYEDGRADGMAVPVATLAALGCEALVLTNAAGSLAPERPAGSLLLIADHLNLTGLSPLVGLSGERRFLDMSAAYDAGLRGELRAAGETCGLALPEGVYAWMLGPQFETPAEVRALRALGADAVGMSSVPEAILARYHGLKVAGISLLTNLGAGLAETPLSHAQTLAVAQAAAGRLEALLAAFCARLAAGEG